MLSPVGARAVTSWETEQLSRVSGCCPPQGRELLPKDFKFAIDDIVAVPRRGASCYRKDSDLDPLEELLSPVGARAVTAISDMKIWFARSCCPPQGRELLLIVIITRGSHQPNRYCTSSAARQQILENVIKL